MLIKLLTIISYIASIYCMNRAHVFEFPLWLICLLFALFFTFLYGNKTNILKGSPGLYALFLAMFGRYVVLPTVYYYTQSCNLIAVTYQHMNSAVYLMLYEQVSVFITIQFCLKKKSYSPSTISNRTLFVIAKDSFLFYGALALFIFIAVGYKSLGEGLAVLQSGQLNSFSEIDSHITSGLGYINIIWQALCVLLYVYLIMKQRAKYEEDRNRTHIVYSIVISYFFILLAFIDQTGGLSRWYTIVMGGSSLAFLCHLYPHTKGHIITFIALPAFFLMGAATMVKNLGYESGVSSVDSSVVEAATSSLFDAYFAGPTNVNTAIALNEKSILGFSTIINDALNNMPIVNHFMNPTKTSNYCFNDLLGRISIYNEGGDQIIPLLGQSFIYFGYLFAPILSILSVLLVFKFDEKFRKDYSFLCFWYGIVSIWFGVVAMMLNFTITCSWIYLRFFPFWIILTLSNKFSVKVKMSE